MLHQVAEELASYCDPRLCSFLAMYIFWIAALAFDSRSTLLNVFFMAPIVLLCKRLVYRFSPEYSPSSNYVISAFAMILLFKASDSVLLQKYQSALRKIGQTKNISKMTVWERLLWATHFAIATRGIGWEHEPREHLPSRPRSGKNGFILSQIGWIGLWLIQWDIFSLVIRANPQFLKGGPSFSESGCMGRATIWALVLVGYYGCSISYTIASIAAVATDLSKPYDWPNLFGSPKSAYTVRNAWGRVWHQMLRKLVTGHMNVLVNELQIPKGKLNAYFKLFGSFFISGLIHYAADFTLIRSWSGKSMRFFPLQAVAIACEDFVIFAAGRLGVQKRAAWVCVGYVWVILWFTFSLPIWLDPLFRAGLVEGATLPISLISGTSWGEYILESR